MPANTRFDLDLLRLDLSVRAKNGLNFILAATLIWLAVTCIWALPYGAGRKSLFTFFAGGAMLPLAWLFSKLLRTDWTLPGNPLQPLGLWLNLAQLAYFPILIFVYMRQPAYFLMVYVIITGAHFLPYAWFYNTRAFAVMAVVISVGAMVLGLLLPVQDVYLIALFLSVSLVVLAIWLFMDYRAKKNRPVPQPAVEPNLAA